MPSSEPMPQKCPKCGYVTLTRAGIGGTVYCSRCKHKFKAGWF